jgi:hypothetical protein
VTLATFPWWDVLSIQAEWGLREEPSEICAARLVRMLQAFEPLHSCFPLLMWTGGRMRPLYPLPTRFEEFARLFSPVRIYDEAQKRRLSDGFSFTADAHWGDRRFIQHHIRAGRHIDCDEQVARPNSVIISTVIRDPDGEDREMVRAQWPALLTVIAAWEPERAGAFSHELSAATHNPARPSFFNGAWAGYVDAKRAQRITAPPEAVAGRSADGGLMLLVTEGILNGADPKHRQVLGDIHAALGAAFS